MNGCWVLLAGWIDGWWAGEEEERTLEAKFHQVDSIYYHNNYRESIMANLSLWATQLIIITII